MEKYCETCKFRSKGAFDEPCVTCSRNQNISYDGLYDNWQPDRPKRKELGDQLSAANAEINRLKVELSVCQQRHKIRDGILTTANAELESMHRELADKQAIIDEQEKVIAELRAQIGGYKVGCATLRHVNRDEVLKLREWHKKDAAVIDLLEKERDDLKRELEAAKRTHTYSYTFYYADRRLAGFKTK